MKEVSGMRLGIWNRNRLVRITEGGEGVIYEYQGKILKLFKDGTDLQTKEKKVKLLLKKALPPEIIRPLETVCDSQGRFIGYLMEKVSGDEIRMLANGKYVKANQISTRDILGILVRMRQVLQAVHRAGMYVGDLNDRNVLFDRKGNIYLIDCDSWSVGGENCGVVMDVYRDPLMQGNRFSESTDLYALSILIWRLLTRIHPHGGTMEPDMNIPDRMKRGICVIDNPAVKIPRTIRSWKHLSPALVTALKAIFENRSRTLGQELEEMYGCLKYCETDGEYYDGRFDCCPLCNGDAALVMRPHRRETVRGLHLTAVLYPEDVALVLNECCYLDKRGEIVNIRTGERQPRQEGVQYTFLKDGSALLSKQDSFYFEVRGKICQIGKKLRSPVYTDENHIYYMTGGNRFCKLTVTEQGNGKTELAKCGYETYFAVEAGHFCLINRYQGRLIINCDGRNTELLYDDVIQAYGIRRDPESGGWLAVLEGGDGSFRTLVLQNGLLFDTDNLRYEGDPANLCLWAHTLYIPMDGYIRGFSFEKQAYRDFACDVVTPDSRLIRGNNEFMIVNDENIYMLKP